MGVLDTEVWHRPIGIFSKPITGTNRRQRSEQGHDKLLDKMQAIRSAQTEERRAAARIRREEEAEQRKAQSRPNVEPVSSARPIPKATRSTEDAAMPETPGTSSQSRLPEPAELPTPKWKGKDSAKGEGKGKVWQPTLSSLRSSAPPISAPKPSGPPPPPVPPPKGTPPAPAMCNQKNCYRDSWNGMPGEPCCKSCEYYNMHGWGRRLYSGRV